MIDLDNVQALKANDPKGVGNHIAYLPTQCRKAWQLVQAWSPPAGYRDVDAVVILGMGGSAIGGDVLRGIVADSCPVPILPHRDYPLPRFVDERTLVIASSYSGNTEETLFGFQEAVQRGAKVLAVTTDGRLAELSRSLPVPLLTFDYLSPPREALGFSLILLLGVLFRLGFAPNPQPDLDEAVALLEEQVARFREEIPTAQNLAKQLALKIHGRIPVIWGAQHLYPVARRWKTQFNENSKAFAIFEAVPEIHHNAVVSLEYPPDLAERVFFILLASSLYHPRNLLRMKITSEILDQKSIPHQTVEVEGETLLSQALSTILLGDYASLYLAALHGVDAAVTEIIDHIKGRMAQGWQ